MNKLQYFIELKQFRIILQKHIKWMQDWHIFQEFTYTCTTFTGSFDCKIYIFSNIVPNNKVIWKTSMMDAERDTCKTLTILLYYLY